MLNSLLFATIIAVTVGVSMPGPAPRGRGQSRGPRRL